MTLKPSTLEIDEILTRLENAVQQDIALRMSQHRSGRSPKSIHAEAKSGIELELLKTQEKLLRDLADVGEIHHSVLDYRLERLESQRSNLIDKGTV